MNTLQNYRDCRKTSFNSKMHHISHKQVKYLLFLMIIALKVNYVSCCYTIKINNTQCQICQSQQSIICLYFNSTGHQLMYNRPACASNCCNANTFGDISIYSICVDTNNKEENKINFTIIITFAVSGLALLLFITYCIIVCRRKRRESQSQTPSFSLDLAKFKLEQFGPLYQDKVLDCPICLNNNCNILTKCKHSFHIQCLPKWLKKAENCPLCKSKEINPILLYCTQCYKQSKIVLLSEKLLLKDEQFSQKYLHHKCNICMEDQYQISIDFENLQSVKDAKSQMNNIESQTNMLRTQ